VSSEDSSSGEEVADEDCLLLQPYIKDPSKTVGDLVAETVASVRESIKVRRFVRFELGLDEQDE
jgi:elongation factor Ts